MWPWVRQFLDKADLLRAVSQEHSQQLEKQVSPLALKRNLVAVGSASVSRTRGHHRRMCLSEIFRWSLPHHHHHHPHYHHDIYWQLYYVPGTSPKCLKVLTHIILKITLQYSFKWFLFKNKHQYKCFLLYAPIQKCLANDHLVIPTISYFIQYEKPH